VESAFSGIFLCDVSMVVLCVVLSVVVSVAMTSFVALPEIIVVGELFPVLATILITSFFGDPVGFEADSPVVLFIDSLVGDSHSPRSSGKCIICSRVRVRFSITSSVRLSKNPDLRFSAIVGSIISSRLGAIILF